MSKILKKIFTIFSFLFSQVFFLISFLIPKKKNLWVFHGWHHAEDNEIFADNTKYFFLFLREHHPEIEALWLSQDASLVQKLQNQGLPAHTENSLKGIWKALRAECTFIDAFLQRRHWQWSGNSKIIQLLHGKGFKKLGYNQKPLAKQQRIFCTSEFTKNQLPKIFLGKTPVEITGFPRGDSLFRPMQHQEIGTDESALSLLQEIHTNGKKCIAYLPTFRRGEKEFDIGKHIPLSDMAKFLETKQWHIFLSLHPKYAHNIDSLHSPYIHFVKPSDVLTLYPFFDVLVTDYSSSFTDFLLLDRPVLFYPYDQNTYHEREGLIDEYDEIVKGMRIESQDVFLQTIEEHLLNDPAKEHRKKIKQLYHSFSDGDSCKRIFAIVQSLF